MATDAPKLTPKQEQLIAALLTSSTTQKAAEAAGVSETTAHRWLRESIFVLAYKAARRAAVDQAVGRLQQCAAGAVAVLASVAGDTKAPASARVSAAGKLLDLAFKGLELDDLATRLDALEQQMGGSKP